jgi:AcrR family transcriptional regulator
MTSRAEAPTDESARLRDGGPSPAVARTVRRALAQRESAYVDEVERLLDAGLEVMEAAGDRAGPRVADVVRRAGLSNQAFYRHFASKDDLVAAVVEAGAWRLVSYLDHQMAKAADPASKLRAWVLGVLSQASNPAVARATRAVLWNRRQLPAGMGGQGRPGAMDQLLVEPLRALGSVDPERDAAAISAVVFGRLDTFLWVAPPTDGDIEHLLGFVRGAVGP